MFNPDNSDTFEMSNVGVEIEFGSGSLLGYFGYDDFTIGGGHDHEIIHIKHQVFGVVMKEHLFDDTFDAIIGLAYNAMADSGSGSTPLFDSMMQ